MKIKKVGKAYFFFKRMFDIVSSFLVMIIFSWLFLVFLIINSFVTKGKPIYVDKRIGKDGKPLNIFKFRSMYVDAETHPERYLSKEELEIWRVERKIDKDPRITKFGWFLRKSSMDELPQILNIFLGHISVVGPRPITKKELETNYSEEEQKMFLSAKPGLVSNWGVNGRNNVTYQDGKRQQLELDYLNKRSLIYDLKLIFKAIFVVLSGKGAQ